MNEPRPWSPVPSFSPWSRSSTMLVTLSLGWTASCHTTPMPARPTAPTAEQRDSNHHRRIAAKRSQRPKDHSGLPLRRAQEIERARTAAQRALLGGQRFPDAYEADAAHQIMLASHVTDHMKQRDSERVLDLLLSLPGSSGRGGRAPSLSGIDGNRLGLFEPLETPRLGAHPLTHFYEALGRLREGSDDDGKVRILAYGASHTDADIYPHYLRVYLQTRFGDGGHGFVHAAKPWRWYRHIDIAVSGFKYWKTEHAQRRSGRDDGYFGLLGASLTTRNERAFGAIRHRNDSTGSRYELSFLAQPNGGTLRLVVDGELTATIDTSAPDYRAGYHSLVLPEGPHELEIHPVGDGEVRVFGWTVERDTPGVVVDTLGIGGTRAANMLEWDEVVWADQIRRRNPDLIMLAYGTNEATDEGQPLAEYQADLREVLRRLQRAAPQASCLLVGPGDFPRHAGRELYVPRERVARIADIQADVARELGCGFWDTLAFMGGTLSMVQWVNAVPQMAKDDHIHLTRRGYVRMGMALVDAMMADYDRTRAPSDTALADSGRRAGRPDGQALGSANRRTLQP